MGFARLEMADTGTIVLDEIATLCMRKSFDCVAGETTFSNPADGVSEPT
jgi:hypothetical protein